MLNKNTVNTLNIIGKNILNNNLSHNLSENYTPNITSSEMDNLILNSNLDNQNVIKWFIFNFHTYYIIEINKKIYWK